MDEFGGGSGWDTVREMADLRLVGMGFGPGASRSGAAGHTVPPPAS
ncbi:hypothetical protein Hanom_Chr15g01391091 [Helianthus anomalus]